MKLLILFVGFTMIAMPGLQARGGGTYGNGQASGSGSTAGPKGKTANHSGSVPAKK